MTMGLAFVSSVCLILWWVHHQRCLAGTPASPQYYRHQLVDHDCRDNLTWTQRYYVSAQHFQGPGHPIFLVLGGEGAIEPSTGLFYPFVTEHLARAFGAYVLEPEHRFYGESQPLENHTDLLVKSSSLSQDPRVTLLTPGQALGDAMRLTRHIQRELLCGERFSTAYCPVISVGGSYPGFLSAMARLRFPSLVDMSYAASAPMKFYSQQVHQDDYYNHISNVTETSEPGCKSSVRTTLDSIGSEISTGLNRCGVVEMAASLGFCPGSVPLYIQDGAMFQNELFMIVGYTFANDNMAYYPPSNKTKLYESCATFMDYTLTAKHRLKRYLESHFIHANQTCMDMSLQLPTGANATISAGDWSGVGTGENGDTWDFQTCTLLVEAIGFANTSMFPPRKWSLEWLHDHCQSRFGVSPKPHKLVGEWHFDDMANHSSRILFTNGLNDGWSVGGILTNLSDTILAINFENGAHHSDLSHVGPSDDDTEDIHRGFNAIQHILETWLNDIRSNPRVNNDDPEMREEITLSSS